MRATKKSQPYMLGPGVRSGCAIPGVSARSRQHERMDRAVAEVTKALLELAAPQPGVRVLDIGCGSGTTTLELAARVGPDGHVLGADIAEQSVARARERIATAGLRHAEVIVADVSSQPFEPNSFDLSFSRFGVMFFSDPTTAFSNVRRAMKPGGRVALAVSAPLATICGRMVHSRRCVICCRRFPRPGRRSQAPSRGLTRPCASHSGRRRVSRGFVDGP
jgi:SAM-dependent methyltransferase